MIYKIDIVNVEPTTLAVVRRQTNLQDLSTVIPKSLDVVYEFLKTAHIQHLGLNVVVYFDELINIEVGVQVPSKFESTSLVQCSYTPTGVAARTIHFGNYSDLWKAHTFVRNWCEQNHKKLTGVSWESYGHWNEDPQKLQTDVYYLINTQ
jgi:effector-binding domain-containing protein